MKRPRHIFIDGRVLYHRPSLITEVYSFTRFKPVPTKSGMVHEPDGKGYAFKFYFDGNVLEERFTSEMLAKVERTRLVNFAGADVLPGEMRFT